MAKIGLRPIRVEGNIAFVPLSQGKEAIIDVDDAEEIGAVNWSCVATGGLFYAFRNEPCEQGGKRVLYLHRAIMHPPLGMQVDHVNGDGLDNRRCNLRVVTATENQRNKRRNRNNASGVSGVSYATRDRTWIAAIKVGGKGHILGHFKEFDDAVAARRAAEIEHGFHQNHGRQT